MLMVKEIEFSFSFLLDCMEFMGVLTLTYATGGKFDQYKRMRKPLKNEQNPCTSVLI